MKKTQPAKTLKPVASDAMRAEYRFDYTRARPNRFAGQTRTDGVVILLEPDIARVFKTPESVNSVLRALIEAMPPARKRKTA